MNGAECPTGVLLSRCLTGTIDVARRDDHDGFPLVSHLMHPVANMKWPTFGKESHLLLSYPLAFSCLPWWCYCCCCRAAELSSADGDKYRLTD